MRAGRASPTRAAGFSLLELALVTCLVAVLLTLAVDRIWAMRVDAERVSVAQTVGSIRSALGLEASRRVVEEGFGSVYALDGTNPMDLLQQTPPTYLGSLEDPDPAAVPEGHWYFDRREGVLVYRVRFQEAVVIDAPDPARLRFRVQAGYTDRNGNGRFDPASESVHGVDLVALDPYRWQGEAAPDFLASNLHNSTQAR